MDDYRKMAEKYGMLNSVENYKLKDNEAYGQDGNTIVCKRCGEVVRRKEFASITNGYVWFLERRDDGSFCACDREMKRRVAEENSRKERLKIYDSQSIRSLIGEFYLKNTFENLPANPRKDYQFALNACKRYCDNIDEVVKKGQGLYIWSPVAGNGKTTLMACMRNVIVNKGIRAVMVSTTELMRQAMDRGKPVSVSQLYSYTLFLGADVLLLDDIGVHDLTLQNNYNNWMQTELYELLDYRNRNNLSTVFTSNYSPEDLNRKRGIDFKTVDRIMERASLVVKIEGESFRGRHHDKQGMA